MKFVHIADTHFDSPFVNLSDREGFGDLRRLDQRRVFRKIVDYVKDSQIPYLFISGDLYENTVCPTVFFIPRDFTGSAALAARWRGRGTGKRNLHVIRHTAVPMSGHLTGSPRTGSIRESLVTSGKMGKAYSNGGCMAVKRKNYRLTDRSQWRWRN